jgi:TPR repeat protein
MLEDGRGSASDQAAAATLYRAAAAQNFGPAQNNFGIMLAEGRGGLKPDPVEAYAWLSLAVENGAMSTARDLLVRQLAPAQIAAASTRTSFLRAQLDAGAAAPAPTPVAPTSPVPRRECPLDGGKHPLGDCDPNRVDGASSA